MKPTPARSPRYKTVVLEMSTTLAHVIDRAAARSGVSVDEWVNRKLTEYVTQRELASLRSKRHPGRRLFNVWLTPRVHKAAAVKRRALELEFSDYVEALIRLNNPEAFPEVRILAECA